MDELDDRIDRRLAGEYQRKAASLADLVRERKDVLLQLDSIRIEGSQNTRPTFLAAICQPYLLSSDPIPLQQLLHSVTHLTNKLHAFDIFSSVEPSLVQVENLLGDTTNGVDLLIKVKESSRFFARTATDIGNGEGNATVTGKIKNVFGGAETLTVDASYGTRTKSNYSIKFDTPLFANPFYRFEVQGYATERDLSTWASCRESLQGITFGLKLGTRHSLDYQIIARHLHQFEPHASLSLRHSAGYNLKSAISHSAVIPLPSSRGTFTVTEELAGFGGDAQHLKCHLSTHQFFPLSSTLSSSLSFRTGFLVPFNGQASLFSDRYQLGGPTCIRSFKLNGLGPKDNADSLGGDLFYSFGASIYSPFYPKPEWPIKLHSFLNAGSLSLTSREAPISQQIKSWLLQPSVSAGVGLMYEKGDVRVEVNLGVPLVAHKLDGMRKGLQFGIGLSFL